MTGQLYITGPLGLWPFPLVNMALSRLMSMPAETVNRQTPNLIEWTDWKGRSRSTLATPGSPGIQTGHIFAFGRSQVTVG
jgi:hypothetical protein